MDSVEVEEERQQTCSPLVHWAVVNTAVFFGVRSVDLMVAAKVGVFLVASVVVLDDVVALAVVVVLLVVPGDVVALAVVVVLVVVRVDVVAAVFSVMVLVLQELLLFLLHIYLAVEI